jgi:2-polyprenyl-3-methyl-5-hydroxy-6-metoxy-1,4-benzoquinol methylase
MPGTTDGVRRGRALPHAYSSYIGQPARFLEEEAGVREGGAGEALQDASDSIMAADGGGLYGIKGEYSRGATGICWYARLVNRMPQIQEAVEMPVGPRRPGFWESGRRSLAKQLGVDLTPSQQRYGRLLEQYITPGVSWLEVGCGRQVLPKWAMPFERQQSLARRTKRLVGIDVDSAMMEHPLLTHRVKSFGNNMPFRDGSFDIVTANMVVEHVENPETFLREIHRVLAPGGRFIFHTTNFANYLIFIAHFVPDAIKHRIVWVLERRHSEDIFPTWYRLNTVGRIQTLAAEGRFTVEDLRVQGSSGFFATMGFLGWLELGVLKATDMIGGGRYASNITCVLKRG